MGNWEKFPTPYGRRKVKRKKKNIKTVQIDAWRYSSADNLRRAFLIHVANELADDQVNDLSSDLFSNQSISKDQNDSLTETSLKNILQSLFQVFLFSIIFCLPVILILLIIEVFPNLVNAIILINPNIFIQSIINIDWKEFFINFKGLIFIPLLLATLKEFPIKFLSKQVTIQHERIDADELFSECFKKVLQSERIKHIEKIVIFIDNLDRLNNEKILEALESLKTYLENDKCIFIVACDDYIVRKIIDGKHLDNTNQNLNYSGEHYLDKFFQQTFRVPEYMDFDLHNFAYTLFQTTDTFTELEQIVEIHGLISIILPSDVKSPRKVKRLINEFISLYQIAKRRENPIDGQLPEGFVKDNLESLGKFSTIRAEYPIFFEILVKKPTLLSTITSDIEIIDDNQKIIMKKEYADIKLDESLIEYLRKTESILLDNLGSYIWLSQDSYNKNFNPEKFKQIRLSLANGNNKQFDEIYSESEKEDYQENIIKTASHLVNERLPRGIEKQHGAKILASILPKVPDNLKTEIANSLAKSLTECKIENFNTDELFNIIRWSNSLAITKQLPNIFEYFLMSLNQKEKQRDTFSSVLNNIDLVEKYKYISRFSEWLDALVQQIISKSNNQTEDEQKSNEDLVNFLNWIIQCAPPYKQNEDIINIFYSNSILQFIKQQTLNNPKETPISLKDNSNWVNYLSILMVNSAKPSPEFWESIIQLIKEDLIFSEVESFLKIIIASLPNITDNYCEQLIESLFIMLINMKSLVALNEKEKDDLFSCVTEIFLNINKIYLLPSEPSFPPTLANNISNLLCSEEFSLPLLIFFNNNIQDFSKTAINVFISAEIYSLITFTQQSTINNQIFASIIQNNVYLQENHRTQIIEQINNLINLNNSNSLTLCIQYLQSITPIVEYKKYFSDYQEKWTENIEILDIDLFKLQNEIIKLVSSLSSELIGNYINKMISLLPFNDNENIFRIFFDTFYSIEDYTDKTIKVLLCIALLKNLQSISINKIEIMQICSSEIAECSEETKSIFFTNIQGLIATDIVNVMPIIDATWDIYTIDQKQILLTNLFTSKNQLTKDDDEKRSLIVTNGLNTINQSLLSDLIITIWENIENTTNNADEFLLIAKIYLDRNVINSIRNKAIDTISKNDDENVIRNNLNIIKNTFRDDLHSVKPIVDIFNYLFSGNETRILIALDFEVDCLKVLNMEPKYQYQLAETRAHAYKLLNKPELLDKFKQNADQYLHNWDPNYWDE